MDYFDYLILGTATGFAIRYFRIKFASFRLSKDHSKQKDHLSASEIELKRQKSVHEFLHKSAALTYSRFAEWRISQNTDAVIVNYCNKNKIPYLDADRLFDLLKDEQNVNYYLDYFRNKGWFVKMETLGTEEAHDLRIKIKFSAEEFAEK